VTADHPPEDGQERRQLLPVADPCPSCGDSMWSGPDEPLRARAAPLDTGYPIACVPCADALWAEHRTAINVHGNPRPPNRPPDSAPQRSDTPPTTAPTERPATDIRRLLRRAAADLYADLRAEAAAVPPRERDPVCWAVLFASPTLHGEGDPQERSEAMARAILAALDDKENRT
jgi:hypothetical protein